MTPELMVLLVSGCDVANWGTGNAPEYLAQGESVGILSRDVEWPQVLDYILYGSV